MSKIKQSDGEKNVQDGCQPDYEIHKIFVSAQGNLKVCIKLKGKEEPSVTSLRTSISSSKPIPNNVADVMNVDNVRVIEAEGTAKNGSTVASELWAMVYPAAPPPNIPADPDANAVMVTPEAGTGAYHYIDDNGPGQGPRLPGAAHAAASPFPPNLLVFWEKYGTNPYVRTTIVFFGRTA